MPKKVIFSTQNSDEKIIKLTNKHIFLFFSSSVVPFVLFCLSSLIMTLFFTVYFIFLAGFIVFLFSLIWLFYAYFTWQRNKYIITDQRVVDIDQISFFSKSQREAHLDRVQDVSFSIDGVFATLFRFGTVIIQTAGEKPLELDYIPSPDKVQKMIFDLAKEKQKTTSEDDDGLMKKMTNLIREALNKEDTTEESN